MKRLIQGLLVAVVLVAGFGVLSVRADVDAKDAKGNHHEWLTRVWKEKIGLSDEQVEKVKAAIASKREAEKPLRKQLHEGVEKLRAQLTLKQGESEIKATLDQVTQTRKALATEREKFKSNLDSILNVSQRAKLLVAFEGKRREFGKGRGGHWGHEGFRRHGKHDKDEKPTQNGPKDGGDGPQESDE